jgi:hypothetical protein
MADGFEQTVVVAPVDPFRAKNLVAPRNSLTSRSSNFSRALSLEDCAAGALSQDRLGVASSRHRRRSVSVVQSILPAIDANAAYSEA